MSHQEIAQYVYSTEIQALKQCQEYLNDDFDRMVEYLLGVTGNIVISGMGKSGHICKKITATLASLGFRAFFLHPAEGLHGDIGGLRSDDAIVFFSHSGESDEITGLLPNIRAIGTSILSVTGRESSLSRYADFSYIFPPMSEAFLGDIVPSTSTTSTLVFGDALAIAMAQSVHFTKKDFARYHPSGALGKKLTLTTALLMRKGNDNATVKTGSSLKTAVLEMCQKPIGGLCIIDDKGKLLGVYTDGDLRRALANEEAHILDLTIDSVMTRNPVCAPPEMLVVDAVKIMQKDSAMISILPVVDENGFLLGTVSLPDIAKVGLIA